MSNTEESKNTIIDLRSDTVTKPTDEMRQAMANADVGDDVFGDDPTVNRLEKEAAAIVGKEAALFVPSGTMGNLIAAIVHCDRFGSEMILGNESHMHVYEQGGCATLGHVHPRPIRTQPDGTLDLADIEAAIRPNDVHAPITRLVCLENTHNRMGGRVLTAEYIDSVGALTKKHNLQLHIDGARIFNAAVFLGIPVSRLVRAADTICVCLSKGLAAPVGSVLCGPAQFIAQARRVRKALGGGMRQAGILAAAGLISINKSVERLSEDHANAKALATALVLIPGLKLDPASVQTNIVFVDLDTTKVTVDGKAVADRLKAASILAVATGPYRIRFVTNYHITAELVQKVVGAMKTIMAEVARK